MTNEPKICSHDDCLRAALPGTDLCASCTKFEQLVMSGCPCCPECDNDSEDYL